MTIRRLILLLALFVVGICSRSLAEAADYSSGHFIVRDPVIGAGSGFSSSSSFGLFSNSEFSIIGTNAASSFLGRFGFLYFPFVTTGTLNGVAGDSQVSLSWGASSAGLGYNISGYQIGVATTSGGPYTYVTVGNVTASVQAGLTNNTQYYFVLRTLDAFGNAIATSNQVAATPAGTGTPSGGPGGNGGPTMIKFSGFAYPGALVSILKNVTSIGTVTAGTDGSFSTVISQPYDKAALYTLYADAVTGERSLLLNYSVFLIEGGISYVAGIRFPPTLVTDKQEVKPNDTFVVTGSALPNSTIELLIKQVADDSFVRTVLVTADAVGTYQREVETAGFSVGNYTVQAHYQNDLHMGTIAQLTVGTETVPRTTATTLPGDCNADSKIDVSDFSVLAYWYGRANPPKCIDMNQDGIINLVDFSILAFYWTG